MAQCDKCGIGSGMVGKECDECGAIIVGLRRTEYRGRKSLPSSTVGELALSDDDRFLEHVHTAKDFDGGTASSLKLIASDPRVPPPIQDRDDELLLPHQTPKSIDGLKAKRRGHCE